MLHLVTNLAKAVNPSPDDRNILFGLLFRFAPGIGPGRCLSRSRVRFGESFLIC